MCNGLTLAYQSCCITTPPQLDKGEKVKWAISWVEIRTWKDYLANTIMGETDSAVGN